MSSKSPRRARPMQITSASAALRRSAEAGGSLETELLFGETFYLYEEDKGWAHGQAGFDSYVGFLAAERLSEPAGEATHLVSALRTYRYPEPDLKSAPINLISMNAKLRIEDAPVGKFVREQRGGWVYADHLAPVGAHVDDYVSVAERFLGTPYYWGGRTSLGLDCSALVQNALEQAGLAVPRDSSQQRHYFSKKGADILTVTENNWSALSLTRGDLVFWTGHVAIMVDARNMIHANATHMSVTVDDLRGFAAKIKSSDGDVSLIVRPQI